MRFVPPREPYLVLELDALYLTTARMHLREAVPSPELREVEERLHELGEEIEEAETRGDADAVHDLSIPLIRTYGEFLEVHSPALRRWAQANILSALSIEAHVNRRAWETVESEGARDHFLRRTYIPEKVQELLRLNGAEPLNERGELFEALQALHTRRNRLVHYEPEAIQWGGGVSFPKLPDELGLTLSEAQSSVDVARQVIREVSERLAQDAPEWLDGDPIDFFTMGFR